MNHFDHVNTAAIVTANPTCTQMRLPGTFGETSSLFNSDGWQEVLHQTYGLNVETISRSRQSVPTAQVQFCEVDDARGGRVTSLPFSDYCDPQLSSFMDWDILATEIISRGKPTKFKVVKNNIPLADPRFVQDVRELWHAVDLTLTDDELWAGLDDMARRNIRKAERSGVNIRIGTAIDDVLAFYNMHVEVRKSKYKLLAQPVEFFEAIHQVFSPRDELFVMLAELEGRPIAGILFLKHGDGLYYKFNASRQLECRPNDLLIWTGIRFGRGLGLKLLDFGISALDQPGLVSFKRKFATEEKPVVQLAWHPLGYSNSQGARTAELLSQLTGLLTAPEVPASLGQRASKLLYPLFC